MIFLWTNESTTDSEAVMRVLVVLVVLAVLVLPGLVCGQGHSLDYEYIPHKDEHFPSRARTNLAPRPRAQVEYNATIQKCRCGANRAWSGSGCSLAEQSYVAVMDESTQQASASPTDAFRVRVEAAPCSQNQVKVTLVPSRDYSNQFSLLPNGSLYWQALAYEHYCFDHTLDSEGKMSWEADVCLSPPAVPRCCHSLAIGSDGSCNAYPHQSFSPPVMLREQVLQWPDDVPERAVSVTCAKYEKLLNLSLNTSQTHLTYASGGVSLAWSPGDSSQRNEGEGFCVAPDVNKGIYNVSVCYEDQIAIYEQQCNSVTCVRKCCPEGEIMHGVECVPAGGSFLWRPAFTDANDHVSRVEPPSDLSYLYGVPTHCQLFLLNPEAAEEDTFLLLNNGNLFLPRDVGADESYPPTHYCIDNFVSQDKAVEKALACFGLEPAQPVCSAIKESLYPALLLVSSAFLGITLVVYIGVPDIRDKLHGRCLISLVAALFVGYTLLATTRLAAGTLSTSACFFLAFVMHLSILAAFFWLNVMCFDIWRTLRKTRTAADGGLRRFLLYSLYAWGCPLLLASVAVIVDKNATSDNIIRPNISKYCWFNGQEAHWAYLYGWVLVLVLANIVFFGLVASILCRAQNDPHLTRSREYNRERMWLYVKLFLVMGVTWLAEVISWQTGVCGALIVTDTLNALQGFIIFVVFVCKRTTLRKVQARWGVCCGRAGKVVRDPLTTLTSLSSSKRDSSRSYSPSTKRSSTASGVNARNAATPLPLQTLQEAPNETSDASPRTVEEGATVIPRTCQESDTEGGKVEETTPLKMEEPTSPLENHSDK